MAMRTGCPLAQTADPPEATLNVSTELAGVDVASPSGRMVTVVESLLAAEATATYGCVFPFATVIPSYWLAT
jgi:hypothetical protein